MPNKRIIHSWLHSITPFDYSPEQLCDQLLMLGLEGIIEQDRFALLKGFVVGEVLTREKHPNADKLSVCTVTTGDEPYTVVCGAPNVAAGQKIVFAPPGTYIASADFTIEKRKIRGTESNGMICSEKELGLGDDHSGIMVLPDDTPVGAPLTEIMGDVIYEVDITPNRADCLSHLGIAREIAALTGNTLTMPSPSPVEVSDPTSTAIEVVIEDPDLCPRYIARVVRGVKVGPSPEWLRNRITQLGLRPRNNIVDIANYVLFECGHPLHTFDYDTISGKRIEVKAMSGNTFRTLDGKDHTLPEGTLMICDAEKPIAVAGVMGGENSEVTDNTVNILIESAYFNPSSIRRTAKRLGIASDASYRFERGADIENTVYAINRTAQLITEIAGGEILSGLVDAYPKPHIPAEITLKYNRTDTLVGITIPAEEQKALLQRLGFTVTAEDAESITVTVPSYRVDIFGEDDLVEEIARLHGYDNIPTQIRSMVQFDLTKDRMKQLNTDTRMFFVNSGFTETVPLYLTDPDTAEAYGSPVALRNALGRDFSRLRTSLIPTMAKMIGLNERRSRPDLRLFEVGKAFRRGTSPNSAVEGIVEMEELIVAISGNILPLAWDGKPRSADIYDLRGVLDHYFSRIGVPSVEYTPVSEPRWGIGAPALALSVGGVEFGRLGTMDEATIARYELSGAPIVALIDMERLLPHAYHAAKYAPPSRFPSVVRDISLTVSAGTSNAVLEQTIRVAAGDLLEAVHLFDVYQGKNIGADKKSLAYSLHFLSHERTLEDAEIEAAMKNVVTTLSEQHGASLR